MNTLQIRPPHLSNVATLPWEIQKKFCHYYSYTSDDLRYLRRKQQQLLLCSYSIYLLLFCYLVFLLSAQP